MVVEQLAHGGEHLTTSGLASWGKVGARQQPALEALQVQDLLVVQYAHAASLRSEEARDRIFIEPAVVDLAVIRRVLLQQVLVVGHERPGIVAAVVPDQHQTAPGTQDPQELPPRRPVVEPVKGLCGHHDVDARVVERRRLGLAGDGSEARLASEQRNTGLAHLVVGLDGEDVIAVLEE